MARRAWIPVWFGIRALERGLAASFVASLVACGTSHPPKTDDSAITDEVRQRLSHLVLPESLKPPSDVTNHYADDPLAAVLGQKFFNETRFSGPLLDESINGTSGTLGM